VTDASAAPALSAAETQAAEALLTDAWGERAAIGAAEAIWDTGHVLRLHAGAGRSVVLKRRGDQDEGGRARSFGAELAALEYLNSMPEPVAPRLLGADPHAGILLMEDLGRAASLADSLLASERARAETDLIAYAQALGSLHAWSMGRPGELADLRARYVPGVALSPEWIGAIEAGREAFLSVAAALGLAIGGAGEEIDQLGAMLNGSGYLGLVHGDACPDNVRIRDGGCRIFDFEASGWGPIVLDAAYLLAPFPSCWCFARLPAGAAAPAMAAYRARLETAGIHLGADWDAATAAALIGWIIARGRAVGRVLEEDSDWGTTTMRPRMLTWLRNFIDIADRIGVLPRLHALAGALCDRLSSRWPGTVVPDYPALAQPGSALARVPDWWQPGV
jgi:Ser/Thr protein kinase RdoA (MazF antagonist)